MQQPTMSKMKWSGCVPCLMPVARVLHNLLQSRDSLFQVRVNCMGSQNSDNNKKIQSHRPPSVHCLCFIATILHEQVNTLPNQPTNLSCFETKDVEGCQALARLTSLASACCLPYHICFTKTQTKSIGKLLCTISCPYGIGCAKSSGTKSVSIQDIWVKVICHRVNQLLYRTHDCL